MTLNGINDLIRKRFSEQHRGTNLIGSIVLNEVKAYFNIKKIDTETDDEIITGYIKANSLFLKTHNQQLKIEIFKKKPHLISIINKKLQEIGYKKEINDIFLK